MVIFAKYVILTILWTQQQINVYVMSKIAKNVHIQMEINAICVILNIYLMINKTNVNAKPNFVQNVIPKMANNALNVKIITFQIKILNNVCALCIIVIHVRKIMDLNA